MILEPRKIKSATVSPSIYHEVMGPDAMILVFWVLSFKPTFFTSPVTLVHRGWILAIQPWAIGTIVDRQCREAVGCTFLQGSDSQLRVASPISLGHLSMPRDISECPIRGDASGRATGIYWVEASGAGKHPTLPPAARNGCPQQRLIELSRPICWGWEKCFGEARVLLGISLSSTTD